MTERSRTPELRIVRRRSIDLDPDLAALLHAPPPARAAPWRRFAPWSAAALTAVGLAASLLAVLPH